MIALPISATADETGAAAMLAYQLERATGIAPEVAPETNWRAVAADAVISVGHTVLASGVDASGLGAWGRHISTAGKITRVLGGSRSEAIWGAAALYLERLGIRQYAPHDLWCSTPAAVESYAVETEEQVPDLAHVHQSYVWRPDNLPYRLSSIWDRLGMEWGAHGFGYLLNAQSFADYPAILSEGWGWTPVDPLGNSQWEPCMYDTEALADALMPAVTATLADHEGVQVGVNDGSDGYCQCSDCLAAIVAAGGDATAAYSAQYHALLEELRTRIDGGKLLVGMGYGKCSGVPAAPLSAGIEIVWLDNRPSGPDSSFPISPADAQQGLVEDPASWETWAATMHPTWGEDRYLANWDIYRAASEVGMYDRLRGDSNIAPQLCTSALSVFLQLFGLGGGKTWSLEGYPSWGWQLAQPYIVHRLSWDTDVDIAAIWEQWAADMFGDAVTNMLIYVSAVELLRWEFTAPPQAVGDSGGPAGQLAIGAGGADLISMASTALVAAHAIEGLTAEEIARIEQVAACWYVTETLLTWMLAETAPTEEQQAALLAHVDAEIMPDTMTMYRADDGTSIRSYVQECIDYILAAKA